MAYITRNDSGKINQFFAFLPDPNPINWEKIDDQNLELIEFLSQSMRHFVKPKWLEFNQMMLTNSTYNRLVNNANFLMVSRLETMSISGNENWQMYKFFWDSIAKDQEVIIEEISILNEIALNCNMPFTFDSNLEMILIPV